MDPTIPCPKSLVALWRTGSEFGLARLDRLADSLKGVLFVFVPNNIDFHGHRPAPFGCDACCCVALYPAHSCQHSPTRQHTTPRPSLVAAHHTVSLGFLRTHCITGRRTPRPSHLHAIAPRAVFALCVCCLPVTLVLAGVSACREYAVWI